MKALIILLFLGASMVHAAISSIKEVYPGVRSTVILDNQGQAFLMGWRSPLSKSDQYQLRKISELTEVKKVVVGFSAIWYLRTNGEVWSQGFHHGVGKSAQNFDHQSTKHDEDDPSLYHFSPIKVPLPRMLDITGTDSRIGGVDEKGKAWFWGRANDLGVDYRFADGKEIAFPHRVSRLYFVDYDQTLIEDSEGHYWIAESHKAHSDPHGKFLPLNLAIGEVVAAVGRYHFITSNSANHDKAILHGWSGSSMDARFQYNKQIELTLPLKNDGTAKLFVDDKKIVYFLRGEIFDYDINSASGVWKKRQLSQTFQKMWSNKNHEFYLSTSQELFASGVNQHGELGFPFDLSKPLQVSGLESIRSVAVGGGSTLALDKDGKLYSWGKGSNLGTGEKFEPTPKIVPAPAFKVIKAGHGQAFGVGHNGELFTWGYEKNYVPPGHRYLATSALLRIIGKKRADHLRPVQVSEVSNIVDVGEATAPEWKFTSWARDVKNRYWTWKAVDKSNPFEGIVSSFHPPSVKETLNPETAQVFAFGYDQWIYVLKSGIVLAREGKYRFRFSNVLISNAGEFKKLGLPPIVDSNQVSIMGENNGLALLTDNGKLLYLSEKGLKDIAESVLRLVPASDLVYLKEDGSVHRVGYSESNQVGNLTADEIATMSDLQAGADHYVLLKNDGTVWTWGKADHFQLGLTNVGGSLTPRKIEL